jgi:nitrogen regulatory protein PII-like uncharacterized protein
MFTKYVLDEKTNMFNDLSNSVNFEHITKGRQGAVLSKCQNNTVPIVRTTTIYKNPTQQFTNFHDKLMEQIKNISKIDKLYFNNALIEIYNNDYRNMSLHSDQALDLEEDSYICLFTCYDNKDTKELRKLIVKEKATQKITEIILDNNSFVIFSTSVNKSFLHKIILDSKTSTKDQWLGITFRLSKTFIKFENEIPHINNDIFRLANDKEKKEFYYFKKLENEDINYKYPFINYTISVNDILPIVNNGKII